MGFTLLYLYLKKHFLLTRYKIERINRKNLWNIGASYLSKNINLKIFTLNLEKFE